MPVGSVGKPAPAIGAWSFDWVTPACPSACGQAEGLSKVAVGSSGTGCFETPTIGIDLREPVPELSTATVRRGTVHRLCRSISWRRGSVAVGSHQHSDMDKRKCFAGSTSLTALAPSRAASGRGAKYSGLTADAQAEACRLDRA